MVKLEQHYNKYRIRFRDERGHRRALSFDSRAEALVAKAFVDGGCKDPQRELKRRKDQDRRFVELSDLWVANRGINKRSANNDQSILRVHLLPAFGSVKLGQIDIATIDAFVARTAGKPKTIHNILTLLVTILRYGVDLQWLDRCPPIRKPRIRICDHEYRFLRSQSEIQRFLHAAKGISPSLHLLYATAIYTGMRAGELAGLKWQRVDLKQRLITVAASYGGQTKGGYTRYVPILDALLPLFQSWQVEHPTDSEFVFPSQAGTMLQPSARVFQERLHRALEIAGFRPVQVGGKTCRYLVFHSLRHTFASHWVMNGGDLFKLQRIGGWKSQTMVQRYAHLAPDAFTADYAIFGGAVPAAQTIKFKSNSRSQRQKEESDEAPYELSRGRRVTRN